MRDIDTLTTREMTQEEWSEFRRRWLETHKNDLVVECGKDPNDPDLDIYVECSFEEYVGCEGYTARDERILCAREGSL